MVNADGTGLHKLTSDAAANLRPAWSPDGTRIAHEGWDGGHHLSVVNADGSGYRQLTTNVHFDTEAYPQSISPFAWSPDGTRIAYHADDLSTPEEEQEIYVVDVDG